MLKTILAVSAFSLTLFHTIGEAIGTETTPEVSKKKTTGEVNKADAVALGKICDGKIVGDKIAIAPTKALSSTKTSSSSKTPSLPEPFKKKGKDAQCITVKGEEPEVFVREKRDILDRLNRKSIALGARSESALKELSYVDDVLVNALVEDYSVMKNNKNKNSNYLFNIIDPKEIKFMFQLSSAAYYKTDFGDNINNISTAYEQKMNTLKAESDNLEAKLKRINKFKQTIEETLENTVVRLKGTETKAKIKSAQEQAEASLMKGSQDQGLALKHKVGQGGLEFEHEQSSGFSGEGVSAGKGKAETLQTRTEGENVKIVSLAGKAVKSIIEQYRFLFSAEPPENATLGKIEDEISEMEVSTKNELLEKKRVQSMLSDPRVGAYWAKLELTYAQRATGLEPIYILYRSFEPYKGPLFGLGSSFIKSKDQPLSKIDDKKELSGIVMYKKHDTKNSPNDEVIIAFSGSKSSEDWKHNFDAFRQAGEISGQLGAGLKMHRGIFQSLQSSLNDAGTNLRFWLEQYLKKYESEKEKNPSIKTPTLKFTITGHSLGGGLALLMATWINDNIKNGLFRGKIKVEIKVYTFGAPPIFRERSAATVEKALGKKNVIRVWNIGDPVANLSLLKREFKDKDPGVVMSLADYSHVGISVPLYDTENLAGFFEKLNPWNNHLSDKYFNLIETNNLRMVNNKINLMEKKLKENKFFFSKIYQSILKEMMDFIWDSSDNPVKEFSLKQIPFENFKEDILGVEESKTGTADLTMKNYEQIKKEREESSISNSPELKRSTRENEEIKYTQKKTSGAPVQMIVNRNTSCDFNSLKKKFNITQVNDRDIKRISCVCCLAKNFILTNKTIRERTKKLLMGKKISTVSETISYCSKENKYCQGVLETGPGDVKSVRKLFEDTIGEAGAQSPLSEAFDALELKSVKSK